MKKIFKITCSSEIWDEVIGYITLEVKGNSAICRGKEYELLKGMFIRTYKNNIFYYNMVEKYGG